MVPMSQLLRHMNLRARSAPSRAGTLVALLLLAMVASACARRLDLTPTELERIKAKDADLKVVRFIPSKKLISIYREQSVNQTYEVGKRKVTERGAYRPLERILGKDTPGKVVGQTELNGMPVLWISFDNDCGDTACAYGFALTELNHYTLIKVPDREKYEVPVSYRRNSFKRNELKHTKQRSLAEANEVFAATRKSGKVLTIDLQIRKDRYRPTRADRERAGGAD